jgi:ATP-dependent Clp protease protease subunit
MSTTRITAADRERLNIENLEAETLKNRAEAALLAAKERQVIAEAQLHELQLLAARDHERDRKAKPGFTRRFMFDDIIDGNSAAQFIDTLEHWEHRDPGEPIVVTFNTPGGSVSDGFAIYDTILRLRRKGHHVTTRALGAVYSMGGVLFQAGEERVMDANAYMMIHEVSLRTGGKSSDMEDDLKYVKRLEDRLLSILAERSTLTKEQIKRRWKKTDWFIDAEQAVELGFADRVE